MDIQSILIDKQINAKGKTELISRLLLENKITLEELIKVVPSCKDADKGTCIEAVEFATKIKPEIASLACLDFMVNMLAEKAPRVKWESAKVIGNIAHLFPSKLESAIVNLMTNAENSGTVVRWSAAFALGEIIKLNTKLNKKLIPAIEAICSREEKNSIKKIYLASLKKVIG